jgi:tRNA threonylcarbamoyladenosine biosynthesis protein TsaB
MDDKKLILALETSGRNGSVALAMDDELLEQKDFTAPMKHSSELFPSVHEILERYDKTPNDIKEVYISVGPGSFTGLRIAVTFAKSMNLANNSKIVAVDSLDVIAANIEPNPEYNNIAVVLDAKRSQFFIAKYEIQNSKYEKVGDDALMTSEDFIAERNGPVWLLGEGLVYYKDKFKADCINFFDESYWWPQAANVYKLGWNKSIKELYENPLEFKPLYLRQPQLGKSKLLK